MYYSGLGARRLELKANDSKYLDKAGRGELEHMLHRVPTRTRPGYAGYEHTWPAGVERCGQGH
jgi:hypothetical protein